MAIKVIRATHLVKKKQNPNQNNSGQKDSADDPSTKTLDNANNGQINILA